MAAKNIFNSAKSYKESADKIYSLSLAERDKVAQSITDFIYSEPVKARYESLDKEQYKEFDSKLFGLLSNIFDIIENENIEQEHQNSLEEYKKLLNAIKEVD